MTLAGVSGLDDADVGDDPLVEVARWLADADAAGITEPRAMQVATAGPSVRTVLLRGLDERGFTFFTNIESRKSIELQADPACALALAWPSLRRQVTATGRAERVADDEAVVYWRTRPRGSQVAAWASAQSRPLPDRATLDRSVADVEARFTDVDDIPLPPFWGGWRIVPLTVELWCGRENRTHDRIRWRRGSPGEAWLRQRLWP